MKSISRVPNFLIFVSLVLISPLKAAGDPLEKCLNAAKQSRNGNIVKVESLDFENKPVYEIEIRDKNGQEHELMCHGQTGEIFEIETEVNSPSDVKFNAKIDLKSATKIALKRFPGKVVEVEYEIEENGTPTYEIDIVNDQVKETKIEIDGYSGQVIEESIEKWQIGDEADEIK